MNGSIEVGTESVVMRHRRHAAELSRGVFFF